MRCEVDAGGRRRHVTIERTGEGFAVMLDGCPYHVDAARIDGHAPWLLSLIVDRGVADGPQRPQSYEVTVTPASDGQFVVQVGSVLVAVAVNGGDRATHRDEAAGAPAAGPHTVHAPMPGKVVRVLVRSGDAVTARQPVVVVEAMKMENELRAGRDGTVTGIHTREGASVEAGALLVVIH